MLNYTSDAIDMYSYVQTDIETLAQCCNYSYQILDKFCARQHLVRLFAALHVCIFMGIVTVHTCKTIINVYTYVYV